MILAESDRAVACARNFAWGCLGFFIIFILFWNYYFLLLHFCHVAVSEGQVLFSRTPGCPPRAPVGTVWSLWAAMAAGARLTQRPLPSSGMGGRGPPAASGRSGPVPAGSATQHLSRQAEEPCLRESRWGRGTKKELLKEDGGGKSCGVSDPRTPSSSTSPHRGVKTGELWLGRGQERCLV